MVSKEDLAKAKEMDLKTYLECYEPYELVHVAGNTYCTREHDSLKISNGKWNWFSRGFGGKTALDYLIKVRGYTLPLAVEMILGRKPVQARPVSQVREQKKTYGLRLPELADNTERARAYLMSRGIDSDIVDWCISRKLIFQTKKFDNVVFAGYDKKGNMKYAALRGTQTKYKGDASGSDKSFSFYISENSESNRLHVFESAIDLLSFATLQKMNGYDWREDPMLSLAGVYIGRDGSPELPKGLVRFLKENPQIQEIHLHLDNDEVGRGASRGITSMLRDKYVMVTDPPREGKDVNDELMARFEKTRTDHER